MTDIIERICLSHNCDHRQANIMLNEEIGNLSLLYALNVLQPEHIASTYTDLGFDTHYKQYFINILPFNQ